MENNNQMDRNILLFFLFSIVIFVLFGFLKPVQKTSTEESKKSVQKRVSVKGKKLEITNEEKTSGEKVKVDFDNFKEVTQGLKGSEVKVETDLYRATFDTKGAKLISLKLKRYRVKNGNYFELIPPNFRDTQYFFLRFEIPENEKLQKVVNNLIYKTEQREESISFKYSGNGLEVYKKIFFDKDSYMLKIEGGIKVGGKKINCFISTTPGLTKDHLFPRSKYDKPPMAFYYDGSLEKIKNEEMDSKVSEKPYVGDFSWCGEDTKYFAAIFLPEDSFNKIYIGHYRLNIAIEKKNKELFLPFVSVPLRDKGIKLFLGPKSYRLLEDYGKNLEKLVDFGFFSFIAKPLYYSLIFSHRYISNWGFCILLISFIITLALFPLRIKQLKSMKDLQKIQPKIKAIQAKYKGAKSIEEKQRMQAELAKIYKETGTSPLATFGGCLPMILQIPVFFAFYNLLNSTIELWRQPFILWIKDLSTYDPTFITPILMGLSMIVQMRQTPGQVQDKNAKMMGYIMPVFLTFILLYISSGVLIYYFSSNVFSSIFQKIYEVLTGEGKKGKGKEVKKSRKSKK